MINYYKKEELKEVALDSLIDLNYATDVAMESEFVSENEAENIRTSYILIKEIVEEYLKLVEPKKKKLPVNQIICLYTIEKKTMDYIAEKFSVSRKTIRNILNGACEIRNPGPINKMNEVNVDYIKHLRCVERMNIKDIAKKFDCSIDCVSSFLKRNNIKKPPIIHEKKISKEQIIKKIINKNNKWNTELSFLWRCTRNDLLDILDFEEKNETI